MPFADLNPKFHFFSPVQNPSTDLAEHVDHAIIALDGRAPIGGDWYLEQLNPVVADEMLRIELWVSDLADYTCTYGFLVSSEDGRVPYARGERSVVNADARPWSPDFRNTHVELMKDLPAFA